VWVGGFECGWVWVEWVGWGGGNVCVCVCVCEGGCSMYYVRLWGRILTTIRVTLLYHPKCQVYANSCPNLFRKVRRSTFVALFWQVRNSWQCFWQRYNYLVMCNECTQTRCTVTANPTSLKTHLLLN